MGSPAAVETATVFSCHSIEYRQVGKRKLNFGKFNVRCAGGGFALAVRMDNS